MWGVIRRVRGGKAENCTAFREGMDDDSRSVRQSARSVSGRQRDGDLFAAVVLIKQVVVLAAVEEGEGMIGQGDAGLKMRHEDHPHHAATCGAA